MTTQTRGKTCLDCVFHTSPDELGGRFHLCILPPDCAPPTVRDDEDSWHDRDVEGRTYLGTRCDVMRRLRSPCGDVVQCQCAYEPCLRRTRR